MKKLKLANPSYRILLSSFTEWLDILGYTEKTVYGMPIKIQEFFYWLENNGHTSIINVTPEDIKSYYKTLKERTNERKEGGLSNCYLNKHQNALRKFRNYLIEHNANTSLRVHLRYESNDTQERTNILTQSEIKILFEATTYTHHWERIQLRDRAMLACLYSCGLRRNEVVQLDVKDVLLDKQRIHVRYGKNNKERFVPFNMHSQRILELYIYDARPEFLNSGVEEALFMSTQGKRMCGQTILERVKKIADTTGNTAIIDKNISPHTLRHSIATHLLQQEVPIENIKSFLGHSSLVSTQVYTHLLKLISDENIY